jgi:hypothetical protein
MVQVGSNLYTGQSDALSTAESFFGKLMNNVIKSQIFLKPQIGLKQLISFMNYGVGDDYVTSAEWFKQYAKTTLNPANLKEAIDFMMQDKWLKDRFARGGSTDALKKQLEQTMFEKMNLFDGVLSLNVRTGDIGAIVIGGKPYIDVLMQKGYTKEQAFDIWREKTINDQQSGIQSSLSTLQKAGGKHPLAKMFFAYQNTPWQYFRTGMNAIIAAKQGRMNKIQAAKITFIYWYAFPLIFNLASSLSVATLLGTGDDDDLKTDLWKSCFGAFTFIPIFGSFINSIFTGFMGDTVMGGDWFTSAAKQMNKTAKHARENELTLDDAVVAVSLFGEGATGLPVSAAANMVGGVADMAQGDFTKGAIRGLGYTKYRAQKVTGER